MERSVPSLAPSPIPDLAESCVRYVQKTLSLDLDYTPETLSILDHYARAIPPDASAEVFALVVPSLGAYFGEVIRRAYPHARWHIEGEDYSRYRLEFERCFLYFNPFGVAVEAVLNDTAEGWEGHFHTSTEDRGAVEASLERLGGVAEEDFYRLTTRYEVFAQVHDLLIARLESKGRGDTLFGPAVYQAFTREHDPKLN